MKHKDKTPSLPKAQRSTSQPRQALHVLGTENACAWVHLVGVDGVEVEVRRFLLEPEHGAPATKVQKDLRGVSCVSLRSTNSHIRLYADETFMYASLQTSLCSMACLIPSGFLQITCALLCYKPYIHLYVLLYK